MEERIARFLSVLTAVAVLAALAAAAAAAQVLPLASTERDWLVLWKGEGQVSFDPAEGVRMQTARAKDPKETFSALVLAKETIDRPLRNFQLALTVTNEAQLREGSPNEWEVFWLFFNYNPAGREVKRTNFLLIQTRTGMQLGRAFGESGEAYLAKPHRPTVRVGQTFKLSVTKTGQHVTVLMDGQSVLDFNGEGSGDNLYDVPGSIGLYCEDSQVRVKDVSIEPLP